MFSNIWWIQNIWSVVGPFPSHPHRPDKTPSSEHLLPHGSWPLHTLARSHPHLKHHGQNSGTRSLRWLDIMLQLPTDHHHRPGTSVSVTALPLPGQTLWHPPYPDDRLSSLSQRARGTLPPDPKGRHNVPRRPTLDWGAPLVLLGIRSSFKADLHTLSAELMYGETLRIPGKFLTPTTHPIEPAHIITQLNQHMARLRPVPATRHARPRTFVHKDLHSCTHVFLRQDGNRLALEPSYSGPYQVISRRAKTLRLLVRGNTITVSTDRVKPAYMLNEADSTPSDSNPETTPTPPIAPPPTPPATSPPHQLPRTTRSGRHVHFPARFNRWGTTSARGWCGVNSPHDGNSSNQPFGAPLDSASHAGNTWRRTYLWQRRSRDTEHTDKEATCSLLVASSATKHFVVTQPTLLPRSARLHCVRPVTNSCARYHYQSGAVTFYRSLTESTRSVC
jgi:hypothetical protein